MLSCSLSKEHDAFSGEEWGRRLQICKFAANVLNLQSLTTETGVAVSCKIASMFYSPRFDVLTAVLLILRSLGTLLLCKCLLTFGRIVAPLYLGSNRPKRVILCRISKMGILSGTKYEKKTVMRFGV